MEEFVHDNTRKHTCGALAYKTCHIRVTLTALRSSQALQSNGPDHRVREGVGTDILHHYPNVSAGHYLSVSCSSVW